MDANKTESGAGFGADAVLFTEDGKKLIRMSREAHIKDYVIPDTVKMIGSNAFEECDNLQSITIPKGITDIGTDAFYGCEGLTTLKVLCDYDVVLPWYIFEGINKEMCKVYVPEEYFEYGFEGTALEEFDVYSLKDLEEDPDKKSGIIVELNINEEGYISKLGKRMKLIGDIHLKDIKDLSSRIYEYLDVSELGFGLEMESWTQCLGMSHSGPVYGKSGTREVDILLRFITKIKVGTLLLPDDVMRRHINAAKNNKYIKQLIVRETCKLFSYTDGKLMNKKKTQIVFER